MNPLRLDRARVAMLTIFMMGIWGMAPAHAETLAQARDAGEAVVLDIEPLPSVTSAEDAAKIGINILLYAMQQ